MERVQAIKETVSNIPSNISSLIYETASLASGYLSGSFRGSNQSLTSTNESISSTTGNEPAISFMDENNRANKSLPIPASLVKEQWRLIFTSDANEQDLIEAIAHAKDLVLISDECSEERKWLVRHLVDLRLSLKQLQDAKLDPHEAKGPTSKTVVGHHFVEHNVKGLLLKAASSTYYCDLCTGIIWSLFQTCFKCNDCDYLAHRKCVDHVTRICAHYTVTEQQYPIANICPEIGLAAQKYQCAECQRLINCDDGDWIEARLCDYNGRYYCPSCHWNDKASIPARIVHNWDFSLRLVSRVSLQQIKLFYNKPLIKLEEANPKLFVFLGNLAEFKTLRQKMIYMRKYLIECRIAIEEKLLETHIGDKRHLLQSLDIYSLCDLEQIEAGLLTDFLKKIYKTFESHIRNCELCKAKAYICEICESAEVLYPFDDGCIYCNQCNSIYHRVCKTRKNLHCPKCKRLQKRKEELESLKLHENGDEDDYND